MVKSSTRFAVAVLWLISGSYMLVAQASGHERVGVEGDLTWELAVGLELGIAASGDYSSKLSLDPCLTFDAAYRRSLAFSLSLPASSWFALDRDSAQRSAWALGDPIATIGYSARFGGWRLGASASYKQPIGISDASQAAELGIATSDGYPTIAIGASATGYLDPIVAGISLKTSTGLPKKVASGWSHKPLSLSLSGVATQALNAGAAISLGIRNDFTLPIYENGVPSSAGSSYTLSSSADFIVSRGDSSIRVGVSMPLSRQSAASLGLGYTYTYEIKEKK
ncbi:MAG: hypothetical protein Q8M76_17305 [Spirochaetaceae bacterium]|nr:hypothetical protein [Spirochaetaceae bacterium]